MLQNAPLLGILSPLAYLVVGLVASFRPAPRALAVRRATLFAAAVGGLAALAAVAFLATQGIGVGRVGDIAVIRVDPISVTMGALVAALGGAILTYSLRYLDGHPRQGAFLGWLAATVGAVMLVVTAGDLVVLIPAWIVSSAVLHQLLTFFPERPKAIIAARKKAIVARVGEASLVAAALAARSLWGTTDIALLAERAAEASAAEVTPIALLIAVAAMLKSAQFPTHGWLVEVMETPTPVSALLHAGIVNGGPFLIIRLAPIVVAAPAVLALLLLVGATTCLVASLVMTTQSSVKVSLAYSSAAHMGFMIFACGLGVYSVALLHLVAHSFYKAHAFLSSGSAVASPRAAAPARPTSLLAMAGAIVVAAAVFTVVGVAFGASAHAHPAAWALGALLVIGLTQLVAQGLRKPSPIVLGRVTLAATGTSAAFFTLELAARSFLDPVLPHAGTAHPALIVAALVVFAAVVVAQLLGLGRGPRGRALYVHLKNGLYINTLIDRLVGAYRR